jgi:hypothetical protein
LSPRSRGEFHHIGGVFRVKHDLCEFRGNFLVGSAIKSVGSSGGNVPHNLIRSKVSKECWNPGSIYKV